MEELLQTRYASLEVARNKIESMAFPRNAILRLWDVAEIDMFSYCDFGPPDNYFVVFSHPFPIDDGGTSRSKSPPVDKFWADRKAAKCLPLFDMDMYCFCLDECSGEYAAYHIEDGTFEVMGSTYQQFVACLMAEYLGEVAGDSHDYSQMADFFGSTHTAVIERYSRGLFNLREDKKIKDAAQRRRAPLLRMLAEIPD